MIGHHAVVAPTPLSQRQNTYSHAPHARITHEEPQPRDLDPSNGATVWLFRQADAYVAVKPHALVSSIPGLREAVGDKVAFARLHDACLEERRRRQQAQQVSERVVSERLLVCSCTRSA